MRARPVGEDSGIHKMLEAEHWTSSRKRDKGSSHCYVDSERVTLVNIWVIYAVEKPHCRRSR